MELYLGLTALFLVGFWLTHDASRLARHVLVAEMMVAEGVDEDAAMEQSGCNFWAAPWYQRVFKPYPALASDRT
jgi:hypothetical protein